MAGVRAGLGRQLGAELRLPARAADEHHEPAGRLVGELGAVVVLDQREGEVDAGGDAGGGPAVPVVDVEAVGLDVHVGVPAGRASRTTPSGWWPGSRRAARRRRGRGRRSTPTPPGPARGARAARASGRRPSSIAARTPIPPTTASVSIGPAGAPQVGEGGVGRDDDAVVGPHRRAVDGGGDQLVAGAAEQERRGPQHVGRPGEVEQLHPVEDDEDDAVRLGRTLVHPAIVGHPARGSKDNSLMIPANGGVNVVTRSQCSAIWPVSRSTEVHRMRKKLTIIAGAGAALVASGGAALAATTPEAAEGGLAPHVGGHGNRTAGVPRVPPHCGRPPRRCAGSRDRRRRDARGRGAGGRGTTSGDPRFHRVRRRPGRLDHRRGPRRGRLDGRPENGAAHAADPETPERPEQAATPGTVPDQASDAGAEGAAHAAERGRP